RDEVVVVGLHDHPGPLGHLRLELSAGRLQGLRVFAGYAGWSGGQLEAEVAEGSWVVVEAHDDDLVSPQPELLWSAVLRRQDDDTRFWTTFPADPTVN
ncbi:MAG: hypothetical protein EON52_11280, partial [Actinomycetales bacterium]